MSVAVLHLLDSLHTWLVACAVASGALALGSPLWAEWLKDFSPDSEMRSGRYPQILFCIASGALFVFGSLAAFLPTSESLNKARDSARRAAKQEWCTTHPGECK